LAKARACLGLLGTASRDAHVQPEATTNGKAM
jgi:hypothetical protein